MSKIDKVKQCLFQIIFFGGFMNYSQIFNKQWILQFFTQE